MFYLIIRALPMLCQTHQYPDEEEEPEKWQSNTTGLRLLKFRQGFVL